MFLFTFSTWAGKFVDNFNIRNLEMWQELVMEDGNPGSWVVANSELQAISHGGLTRLLTIGDDSWRDYTIEFDVKPLEKHGPGNIAIAARVTGTRVVVCVIGDMPFPEPESKLTCLGGNFHGQELRLLHTEAHRLLKLDEWSHLKLSVNGNHFIFWVNRKKITETGDRFILVDKDEQLDLETGDLSSFPIGGAGFGITNYTAIFDKVVISGDGIPDQDGLSVTPQVNLAITWSSLKRF